MVPQDILNSISLCPISFASKVIHLYVMWAKNEAFKQFSTESENNCLGGDSKASEFICDGPIKEAHCKK
jgi:hypothetical protein